MTEFLIIFLYKFFALSLFFQTISLQFLLQFCIVKLYRHEYNWDSNSLVFTGILILFPD
jgi:hypothetical protein